MFENYLLAINSYSENTNLNGKFLARIFINYIFSLKICKPKIFYIIF